MNPTRQAALTYRPDIDGLRALAVLLVLAYHFFPEYWGGGFLGVDIFFVISGFLITGIVSDQLEQGKFSFVEFYLRRVRRLFPALVLVLVSILLVSYWLFIPYESEELGRTLQAAATFIPNLYFWQHTGYFDIAANRQPLVHLWSLGVEEQFYFVWPALLVAIRRFRLFPALLLVPLTLLSLIFAASRSGGMLNPDFHLLQFHAWELAAGSVLALYGRNGLQKEWQEISSWFGVYLIGAGVAWSSLFGPTLTSVIAAVTGSGLFIAGGPAVSLNVLFSGPGPVKLGQRSYSLYLWHWPLLCVAQIVSKNGFVPAAEKWNLILFSLLLADATFRFVERPTRKWRLSACYPLIAVMGCLAIVGHVIGDGRLSPRSARFSILPKIKRLRSGSVYCARDRQVENVHVCDLSLEKTEVLVWGDSNSIQYAPRVERLMKENPKVVRAVSFVNAPACPPINGLNPSRFAGCIPGQDIVAEAAARPEVKIIVLAAQWTSYFDGVSDVGPVVPGGNPDEKQMILSLESFVRTWQAAGKEVVVILSTPYWPPGPQVLIERSLWKPWTVEGAVFPRAEWDKNHVHIVNEVRRHVEAAGARVIDPTPFVCDASSCPAFTPDGMLMYADADHLSDDYVRERFSYLDELFLSSRAPGEK